MTRRALLLAAGAAGLRAQSSPDIRIDSVRRVFHDGAHNAFTDLIRFRGRLYLTFRTCPDGHMVHPTSSILILESADGADWHEVCRFSVPLRDVRDPHFLNLQGKLFVYSGAWYCGSDSPETYDMNQQLGYAVWSSDGESWSGPQMLEGTYGHYVWRAASNRGKAYLCGRRKRGFAETTTRAERDPLVESALLESEDGLAFRPIGLFQESYGNETAFLFEKDGSILAVARGGGSRNAELVRSQPPYRTWRRRDLGRYVGGPLVTKWGDRYLVGGRELLGDDRRMSLYWLAGDVLRKAAELPSGGDNSYPGFVELNSSRGLLSYYSTHERSDAGAPITAIYLAELAL